jgi:hypothetical protein
MTKLLESDPSLLVTAPVRVRRTMIVPASPGRFWAVLAEDPGAWGSWCPGFTSASRWTTPVPAGVGSQRVMHAFGTTFLETVLEWNDSERFTFCVNECGVPGLRRFVESWSLEHAGAGDAATTRATWTMAAESSLPDAILRRWLSVQQTVMMTLAGRRLARLLRVV